MSLNVLFYFIILILLFALLQILGKIILQKKNISQLNNEKYLLLDAIDFVYNNFQSKKLVHSFCKLIKSHLNIIEIIIDKNNILSNKNINIDILLQYINSNKLKIQNLLQSNKVISYSYKDNNDIKYNLYITYQDTTKKDFIIFMSNIDNKELKKINILRFIESISHILDLVFNMKANLS